MASVKVDAEKLFEKARAAGELDAVEDNLFNFCRLFQSNYEFRRLVREVSVPVSDRVKAILEIRCFKPSSVFRTVLILILQGKNLERTMIFQELFTKIADEKLNRKTIQVISSVPLPDSMARKIQEDCGRILKSNVHIRHLLDETLIAGLVIKLPDGKIFDFSLKKQLAEYKSFVMEKE